MFTTNHFFLHFLVQKIEKIRLDTNKSCYV
jgi:hypothetical protein